MALTTGTHSNKEMAGRGRGDDEDDVFPGEIGKGSRVHAACRKPMPVPNPNGRGLAKAIFVCESKPRYDCTYISLHIVDNRFNLLIVRGLGIGRQAEVTVNLTRAVW